MEKQEIKLVVSCHKINFQFTQIFIMDLKYQIRNEISTNRVWNFIESYLNNWLFSK